MKVLSRYSSIFPPLLMRSNIYCCCTNFPTDQNLCTSRLTIIRMSHRYYTPGHTQLTITFLNSQIGPQCSPLPSDFKHLLLQQFKQELWRMLINKYLPIVGPKLWEYVGEICAKHHAQSTFATGIVTIHFTIHCQETCRL